MVANVESCAHDLVDDEGVEELAILLQVEEIGPGETRPLRRGTHRSRNCHQAFLANDHRKRPQQNAFDPTEDRGVSSDTKSQAEQRKECKTWAASHHAKTEVQILTDVFEEIYVSHFSTFLL